eukprot:gene14494-17134_t
MSRRGWRERPRRCGDFSWHHEVVAHEAAEVRAFGEARQCYVDAVLRPELGSLEDATEFFRGLPGMAGVWAAAAQSHGLELSAGTWDTGAGVTEGWLRANGLALSGQLNRFDGNGPEEPNEFQDPVHMDVHGALVDTLVGVLSMRTLTTLDLSGAVPGSPEATRCGAGLPGGCQRLLGAVPGSPEAAMCGAVQVYVIQ